MSLHRQISTNQGVFNNAMADATDGVLHVPADATEDFPEWLKKPQQTLAEPEIATQVMESGTDDLFGEREQELQANNPDLNAKTYALKRAFLIKADIVGSAPVNNVYVMLKEMADSIRGMEDGEDKEETIYLFNCINAIFKVGRKNDKVRTFAADLFTAQVNYYENKEKLEEVDLDIKLLTKLYDEQEKQQMLEKWEKTRQARKVAMETAAMEKAAKNKEEGKPPPTKKPNKRGSSSSS